MPSQSDASDVPDVPESDEKVRVVATDLRVGASGRVTIPEEKRNRYGIEQGDYIDAVLFVNSEDAGDAQ